MPVKRSPRLPSLLAVATAAFAGLSQATTIQIVVDNDFAILVGNDSSGFTRMLYQNDVVWNQQVTAASTFDFQLQGGENTFYILAMGGGGQENISGKINGVNITETAGIKQSQNIASSLFAYNKANIVNGTYNADLASLQGIFINLTWGDPTLAGSEQTVIAANTHSGGKGYTFGDSHSVIYKFSTASVGLTPVPETSSTLALGGLLSVALLARKRRR